MDESETAVDGQQPETAPRIRPANAFDQWFVARDFVAGQIDTEKVELLPIGSMSHELRGLWNANEQILATALTDKLPREHLSALRATLRDVESIAMEEERLFGEQEASDVGASPPASRLQPWEPAFNERLRGVFDRKRRLLATLLSQLTSAQDEVVGVAAAMAARLQGSQREDSDNALVQRRAEQQRLADTAFGREALELLAKLHSQTPRAWRELAAFNGCGGERWNKNVPAKNRGKGYDNARKMLAAMAKCGLIEKATSRGAYRIADDGLRQLSWPKTLATK